MSTLTRILDAVLPAPNVNRLVPVTEVGRGSLPLVEGSLADVGVVPIIREIRSMTGQSSFQVLVPKHDADVASQVVAGI